MAHQAGVDVTSAAQCKPIPPEFACGDVLCSKDQYCLEHGSAIDLEHRNECAPFDACGSAMCACVKLPPGCACLDKGASGIDGVLVKCQM